MAYKYLNKSKSKMVIYLKRPSRLTSHKITRMRPEQLYTTKGSFTKKEINDLSTVANDINYDENPDKDLLLIKKKNKFIVERF